MNLKTFLNGIALFIGISLIIVGCLNQNQDKLSAPNQNNTTQPRSVNIHLKYGNPSNANLKDTNNSPFAYFSNLKFYKSSQMQSGRRIELYKPKMTNIKLLIYYQRIY